MLFCSVVSSVQNRYWVKTLSILHVHGLSVLFVCCCKPSRSGITDRIATVYPIAVLAKRKTCLGQNVPPLPSGILSGQIQKAPPVYGSFYACYSYRYPQKTPRPLPEWRQILGELSAVGGRADPAGSSGSVRKLSEVPTRSAERPPATRARSLWALPVLGRQIIPRCRSALCGAAVRSVSLSELSEIPQRVR